MSRIIHWDFVEAIGAFRENPAALAVYIIYVSRQNIEGVAWPSLASLKRDTKWGRESCLAGRHWLVEHGALQRVLGYVREEWRDLEPEELQKKLALDQSEYYRPTGIINIDGETIELLFFGRNAQAGDYRRTKNKPDEPDEDDDSRRHLPSVPSTVGDTDDRQRRLESNATLQGSATSQSSTTTTSAEKASALVVPPVGSTASKNRSSLSRLRPLSGTSVTKKESVTGSDTEHVDSDSVAADYDDIEKAVWIAVGRTRKGLTERQRKRLHKPQVYVKPGTVREQHFPSVSELYVNDERFRNEYFPFVVETKMKHKGEDRAYPGTDKLVVALTNFATPFLSWPAWLERESGGTEPQVAADADDLSFARGMHWLEDEE